MGMRVIITEEANRVFRCHIHLLTWNPRHQFEKELLTLTVSLYFLCLESMK